jgi:OmpA-OmpF porin, OOP family
MNGTTKFIIGAVATSLMAMASHSALGLEGAAQAKLTAAGGLAGVTAAVQREPSLQRVIILSGTASDEEKAKLIAEMKAIPGVKDARWADDAAAAPTVNVDQTPATVEAVKNCQTDVDKVIAGKVIQFDSGAATIKAESQPLIDALAAELGECAGTTVEVAGHTDLTGGDAANQRLSEERANSVVAALVAKGLPGGRLLPKGFGETKPKATGMDEAANATNRRIEFPSPAPRPPRPPPNKG